MQALCRALNISKVSYRWEEGKAAPTSVSSMDSMDESGTSRLVINSHFDSGNIEVIVP